MCLQSKNSQNTTFVPNLLPSNNIITSEASDRHERSQAVQKHNEKKRKFSETIDFFLKFD